MHIEKFSFNVCSCRAPKSFMKQVSVFTGGCCKKKVQDVQRFPFTASCRETNCRTAIVQLNTFRHPG